VDDRQCDQVVMGQRCQSLENTNGASQANSRSEAILNLPKRDRLVFIICLLDGYSIHDCAVLLGRSREINEVRHRADIQIGQIDELGKVVTFGMSLISVSAVEEKWVSLPTILVRRTPRVLE
jgi:hypothetical protein